MGRSIYRDTNGYFFAGDKECAMCICKPVYPVCQSCGMPMAEPQLCGTDEDGGSSEEYCCYCFQEGVFTVQAGKDAFIELQVKIAREKMGMDEQQAREMVNRVIPTLKRWQQ